MNKKFSTLMAGLLLASAFTVNAQEDSSAMPRSAAIGQDVKEFEQVGTGKYGSEDRFYQLADGTPSGNKVLAMIWNGTDHYELKMVDLAGKDIPLDNTLWQVSAQWDQTSGTLNYILVNKATLLPLQVSVPEDVDKDVTTPDVNSNAYVDANSAAQTITNWRWNNNAENLGSEAFYATVSTTETVGLYVKNTNEEVYAVKYQTGVSTGSFIIGGTVYSQVLLRPVEAGRVVLTAEQINTKLNNATDKDRERLDIVFDPEVINPDKEAAINNVITQNAWVAKGHEFEFTDEANGDYSLTKKSGSHFYVPNFSSLSAADQDLSFGTSNDVEDQFVQLVSYKDLEAQKKDVTVVPRVLMVDTAYYDSGMNDKYDLTLALKKLEKTDENYDATGALLTGSSSAYASFEDQTLFQFIYEPTYDRVLIYAKQATYVLKTNLKENYQTTGSPYKPFACQTVSSTAGSDYDGFWNDPTVDLSATNLDNSNAVIAYNQVKLVYLTPTHSELTVNVPDENDQSLGIKGYGGALTEISLKGTKRVFGQWTYADIAEGFYYIQNARTEATSLIPVGAWAYQDLTATSASASRNDGNVVYSTEKFETMPSAQWYIQGKGGYFTVINRESGKDWSTNYWYAVKDKDGKDVPNTYTNYGTFGANGISTMTKDTIRIEAIPASVLNAKTNGYLNISQAEAKADTSVFTFKYVTPLDVNLNIDMKSDSTLAMSQEGALNFKLERVKADNEKYGYYTAEANRLQRVAYYIYADEVSSNSTEGTGYHERKYVVLEGGAYRLVNMLVEDKVDGTTKLLASDDNRAKFYVKEIGEAGKNYVLVDTDEIKAPASGQGQNVKGVRMVVDQVSLGMRANGLPSVAENVYSNSLLNLVRAASGNYRADLAYGDTVKIFSNEYPEVVMYENNNMLAMSSLEVGRDYNTAMFVDTAYVRDNTARPQFMFVLRPVEDPNCNFPNHEHHAIEGDYLMHMQDSVEVDVNKYTWDNKKFARLGFVPARHEGDSVIVTNSKFTENSDLLYPGTTNVDYKATTIASQDTMILSDNTKDQYCTFALRYVDTNRDAFYLETLFKKGSPETRYETAVADKRGWVRWHNGVPVVVDDLSQAGKFNFEGTDEAPTANDAIATSEVSIVAVNGAVIVKNAAGKKVAISNILGQNIANTVLSSDNETIAAPAGIVVVAVEGEEAVKAVVK